MKLNCKHNTYVFDVDMSLNPKWKNKRIYLLKRVDDGSQIVWYFKISNIPSNIDWNSCSFYDHYKHIQLDKLEELFQQYLRESKLERLIK